jgi:hypothetical protein
MNDVLNFTLPAGYHVAPADTASVVECERGCGWKMRVSTLAALPDQARDQLFRYHEQWHTSR